MSGVRVRFAPSPTGYLHIGNVRTALFNHLFAACSGGELILRIENTDRERSKSEYAEQILNDLRWLGIRWQEGPDIGGPYGPYRQSERMQHYRETAEKFIREGKAYYCFCSQEELETIKRAAQAKGLPPKYNGRCRKLSREEVEQKRALGLKPSLRFKVEEGFLEFEDIIRGPVRFDMGLFGDFVILRPDGVPTFHLAVCVDDVLMRITHVIRGEDHLPNTPRHILLFRALGEAPPRFAHVSLIMGKGGEPLSKRLGAMSVEEYRKTGYLPEAVDNYIALLGWAPGDNREIFSLAELEKVFSLSRVGKSPAVFDKEKLDWLSGEHIRALSHEAFVEKACDYLVSEGLMPAFARALPQNRLHEILLIFKDNILHFDALRDRLEIFNPEAENQDAEMLRAPQVPGILKILEEYFLSLAPGENADYEALNQKLKAAAVAKGKELFMPVRVALTFRAHGPELKKILPLLARELCLERIKKMKVA
ncbi:MAG: glutamate--tRNA ligase [Candidatus Omnitrophica bacterium]|nr:glutamate--tRNA ligase [Candidatus Omnitrophota bacterium]